MSKTARDSDPQCQALYEWEDQWGEWNRNLISLRKCRLLIRQACEHYGVKAPTVVTHDKGLSWSIPHLARISILGGEHRRPGHLNVPVALHEAAHHIAWIKYGNKIQDHGPTFLGLYLDLLDRARVAPRLALEATARSFKLKWVRKHS